MQFYNFILFIYTFDLISCCFLTLSVGFWFSLSMWGKVLANKLLFDGEIERIVRWNNNKRQERRKNFPNLGSNKVNLPIPNTYEVTIIEIMTEKIEMEALHQHISKIVFHED